jgi:ADP-ribose pyrophosphatase YjhB (NUDIX family)
MKYNFCPLCKSLLKHKKIDGHKRQVCLECGFIYYQNPTPAVAVIISIDGKLVLVKRKYEPFAGLWSLPAGFMEYGETSTECAVREAKEETNLKVKTGPLVGVYNGADDPRSHVILVVYQGQAMNRNMVAGDDASHIELFSPNILPKDIAFRAHRQAIKDYLSSLK